MPEIQQWQQPTRVEILTEVRDILVHQPSRHYQGAWLDNVYDDYASLDIPIGDIRAVLDKEIRRRRDDDPKGNVCGTRGCAAGLIVMVGSAPGEQFTSTGTVTADGVQTTIGSRAIVLAGLNANQADWLFSAGRSRYAVIAGLEALIDDPGANLYAIDEDDEIDDPAYTVQIVDSAGDIRWEYEMTSGPDETYDDMLRRAANQG